MLGVALCSIFNKKVRKMWQGERRTIGILKEQLDPSASYVWFHAASLGEFEQGRPLIERMRARHPEYKILLTFFSPSGYEVRKDYAGADIVCYLPLDTIRNARRFLRTVRPVMAFFIKYEFWYNYLHILRHRNVPVYSVSSIFRPDQVFFRWYGRGYARVLRCITKYFVQNEVSKELLAKIGVTDVEVIGDTRFDRVVEVKKSPKPLPIIDAFVGGSTEPTGVKPRIFVAGSSWQPDEDVFISYFNAREDWKMIIAPHVISQEHISEILSKVKGKAVRYTAATAAEAACAKVIIIDCFGLLSSVYRYADIAYVGGGFGSGIHNVLEAAVWGVPVLFGPNNTRFQEAQQLLAAGGCHEVKGADDFAATMDRFVGDEAYRKECGKRCASYVDGKAGVSDLIMQKIGL